MTSRGIVSVEKQDRSGYGDFIGLRCLFVESFDGSYVLVFTLDFHVGVRRVRLPLHPRGCG